MARYSGKKQISEETHGEAMRLAKGTQRPAQTKAQTRLIAQGIERGIDLYKKEQKEKARSQDRREREKRREGAQAPDDASTDPDTAIAQRRNPLPWILLGLTWAGIAAYWVVTAVTW